MNDLISRQAAVDALADMHCKSDEDGYVWIIRSDAWARIDALPSAQPERKKGEWLRYGEDGYPNNEDTVFWQCDQCLEQYTGRAKKIPNFCPNCGAKMRGEQDG